MTEEELHEFAKKIGMKREWFQPQSFPHYDVSKSRKKTAIELGAKLVDMHGLANAMERFRDKNYLKVKLK